MGVVIEATPASAVPQSLGVCVCAGGFGVLTVPQSWMVGSWSGETLMDSRLSAVSYGTPLPREVLCSPPPGSFSLLHSPDYPQRPCTQPAMVMTSPSLLLGAPPQDTASRFLHRLGATMVEGPDATLWMFGGPGPAPGLLGNLYRWGQPGRGGTPE